jgi:MSHA biogenesis protein MshL
MMDTQRSSRIATLPAGLLAGLLLLTACAPTPQRPDPGHLAAPQTVAQDIPAPVQRAPQLEPPQPAAPLETYSVVVTEVPVKDMLFALARDARLNVDIHPGVGGTVTLNAIDQTLPQILDRIARQTDVRFTQDGDTLQVEPDTAFLRSYKIDYVNMGRNNTSNVSVATQIATTGQAAVGDTGGGGGGNNSTTDVTSTSNHQFWGTLERNVRAILGDAVAADAAEGSTAVIVNAESGILTVRATTREHRQIQGFLDQVLVSAQRQVMIEATVVEVKLNDQYQLGVDWSLIANGAGWSVEQALIGTNLSEEPFSLLTYADPDTRRGDVTANIGMLRQFGDVKVLSSPRIMAINNQTALLKVVDNLVYFTIEADTVATDGIATTTFTSTVHTVPVGFVMSVTPQINDTDTVILNIRPTISRVTSFVRDPNPSLAPFNIESSVPQIQVREMDSLLRINSGQTAVLGGLIQDSVDLNRSGTPVLSELPGIGDAFSYRDNRVSRSELVIFLRPRVIREASVGGELVDYQRYLPDRQRISAEPERLTERLPGGGS